MDLIGSLKVAPAALNPLGNWFSPYSVFPELAKSASFVPVVSIPLYTVNTPEALFKNVL